jgi:hypothetical protein
MRSLSVVDVIIITAVVALLVFLSTKDFQRYAGRSFDAAPPAAEGKS